MPKVVLAEEISQILEIQTFETILDWCLPDPHQGIDILQNRKSFSPESQFDGDLKLFHSDLNVPSIDISLLNINIDIFLHIRSISLIESILQSSS